MLQSMRTGAARWLGWVIVIIIIIALTLWGISYYFTGGNAAAPVIVKVNGIKITQAEFNTAYHRLRQTNPKLFTNPDVSINIKQQLLQMLTTKAILSQAATTQGFAIGDQQLNTLITNIPAFQIDGKFSTTQFSMILNRALFTPQQFMQNIRETLLIDQVRNGIAASAFALPQEVKQFNALLQQRRDIGYLIIPASRFSSIVKITPEQIKTFYQQHRAAFNIPEKISLAYLAIAPTTVATSIKPSQTALHRYYNNNLSDYTVPARWHVAHILLPIPKHADAKQIAALKAKLNNVRAQAAKGTPFTTLVKQTSEDVLTINNGGEMPWFSAGGLDPVFERTVSGLNVGQISAPVQTSYGMELIKLLAVQPQQVKTFAEVAPQVKQAYINQQVVRIMAKQKEALANLTFENPDSLHPAARQLNLTIKTTPLITRSGTKTGITANANMLTVAFSNDVLRQGNNSDVITLQDGTLVVLRVRQHQPATVKPLAAVKQQIIQQLTAQQAAQQAKHFGKHLLPQMTTPAQAIAVAAKHQLHWRTETNVGRQTKDIQPLILQQAFNMSAPIIAGKLNLHGIMLANGNYALVAVAKVYTDSSKKLSTSQTSSLQQQLAQMFAATEYDNYVHGQWQQATIKVVAKNWQ